MIALAASCAAVAVALGLAPSGTVPTRGRVPVGAWPFAWLAVLGAAAALRGDTLVLGLIVGAAATGGILLARRARSRKAADETRQVVVEACEAITSELRAGQPPLSALEHSLVVWPALAPAVAAARLDADVPAAFRRLSLTRGAATLAEVAAAWELSRTTGAGLASALDRVLDSARDELEAHRVVAAELASTQATARMIAVMPVVLIVLSDGAGGDPWEFLLTSTPGLACLGAGLGLALVGMWWIDRIVTRVERGEL